MENMFNDYYMIEEVKERAVNRAVNRGSGVTEFESYDRVAKIERRSGVEDYAAGIQWFQGLLN